MWQCETADIVDALFKLQKSKLGVTTSNWHIYILLVFPKSMIILENYKIGFMTKIIRENIWGQEAKKYKNTGQHASSWLLPK